MNPDLFTAWQRRVLANALVALAIAFFIALAGATVWVAATVFTKLQWVLLPVAIGMLVAYLLMPAVDWLHTTRRWSRLTAVLLVFGAGTVAIVAVAALALPAIVQELTDFASKMPAHLRHATTTVSKLAADARAANTPGAWHSFVNQLTTSINNSLPDLARLLTSMLPSILSNAIGLLSAVVGFLIIPVYVFHFLKDPDYFSSNWKLYVPVANPTVRDDIIRLVGEINESLQAFFRGQCIVAACVGALSALGFYAIGVDFALLLGIWVGLFDLVPLFGVVAGAIPAALIAYAQYGGWHVPAEAIGVCVLVHLIENWILAPRIVGDKTGLHPVSVVLSILIWGHLLGFIGVLLAVPLTSTLTVLFRHYLWRRLPAKS
ncbi:MAG: AI-2E family transporter [Verrucomicrobia bacterium]|nr:AI-2E family transporter [Verrucomicrobiota bacterium]